MLKNTLTPLLSLGFSTAPLTPVLGSAGSPDPQAMMLLWYAVVGIMGVLSMASTAVSVLQYIDQKKDRARAAQVGGFVTHDVLLSELKQVYGNMQRDDKTLREDIMHRMDHFDETLTKLTASVQALSNHHARLDGQLNPIALPAAPTPRTRPH